MRISLPSRAYGFVLALSSVLACVLFALVLPSGARAAEACPNEQLRQESNINQSTSKPYSTELPECRAYEQVSPVIKNGNPVQASAALLSGAPSGGALAFSSEFGTFSGPEGFEILNPYVSYRTASGWVSHAADVSASIIPQGTSIGKVLYAPDLSREVICGPSELYTLTIIKGLICAERGANGVWEPATPPYHQVGKPETITTEIVGASRDLSHVVLKSANAILTGEGATGISGSIAGLYEISGVGTPDPIFRLVNVENNGEQIGTVAPGLGNSRNKGTALHAVSEDGSTVFFQATPTGGAQTVYARIEGAYTVAISKPSTVDCVECQTSFATQLPAEFQGASADGSKVFFTTEQELFAGQTGKNLYEYDFDAPIGHRVIVVSRGSASPGVQGVLINSDDGSRIDFVAQGALTSTANGAGQHAVAGADNLYVFERDQAHSAGQVDFVAMLCSGKEVSGTVADAQCPSSSSDSALWATATTGRRAGTTPNGRYLIFDTYAHLLSEDKNEAQAVYCYDSETGELTWVSHGAPGFAVPAENKSALIPDSYYEVSSAFPDSSDKARAISEDGSDIVFTTTERLAPTAPSATSDVYLWHDGTVSLISAGGASTNQFNTGGENIAIMSASGADIYFASAVKLVDQDTDAIADIYDARIDGGFPVPKVVECAAEESGQERGEACQGAPSSATPFGAAASSLFTGGANVAPLPSTTSAVAPKSKAQPKKKALTRAQKLSRALKACRKVKAKKKRVVCEKQALKKYGGKAKASKSGRGQ